MPTATRNKSRIPIAQRDQAAPPWGCARCDALCRRGKRLAVTDRFQRSPIARLEFRRRGDAHAEMAEQPVLEPVNPAVDRERLAALPGVADDRRLTNVAHLLDHVQFAEDIDARLLAGRGVHAGL